MIHPIEMSALDWLDLFNQFASLSLLAVGGAITTAPGMHRNLVDLTGWLSEEQFASSIALAQAAPGPNVLFVALMGWNVGLNSAAHLGSPWLSGLYGLMGVLITMSGMMLPSSVLTYLAIRWAQKHRDNRAIRAFKSGMAPIVIALLLATGWLLAASHNDPAHDWPLWLLVAVSMGLVWRTRVHILWIMGGGALLGAVGLI